MELSKKNIEKLAGTELINYANKILCVDPKIEFDDKNISWDGVIDIYKSNKTDLKSEYISSLDVQVKGKSINIKIKGDKVVYDIEVEDLKNYLKKNGTLFFVTTIDLKNSLECKLYCKPLLRTELYKMLSYKGKQKTIRIKPKLVKSPEDLERILFNFNKDREVQSKISDKVMMNSMTNSTINGEKMEFYEFRKEPIDLVGEEKYAYQFDKNDNIVGCVKVIIDSFKFKEKVQISTLDKSILYEEIVVERSIKGAKASFGKSFTFSGINSLNININGSLRERLKDLKFISKMNNDKAILIDGKKVNIDPLDKFNELIKKYLKIESFLDKYKIKKDFDFDNWSYEEKNRLLLLIEGIEYGKKLYINECKSSILCCFKIHDLSISLLGNRKEDSSFEVETVFNNPKKYYFKLEYTDGNRYETDNKFLVLDRNIYLSDDINIEEIKNSITEKEIIKEDIPAINKQILELLFAYDIDNSKNELLDLAEYYLNLIKEKDDKNINVLNYYQIEKRKRKLTDKELRDIMKIKVETEDEIIRYGCNILLESYKEAKLIYNSMNHNNQEFLKREFPIINLIEH